MIDYLGRGVDIRNCRDTFRQIGEGMNVSNISEYNEQCATMFWVLMRVSCMLAGFGLNLFPSFCVYARSVKGVLDALGERTEKERREETKRDEKDQTLPITL